MKFSEAKNSIEKSSQYMKFAEGDTRIRIVSEALKIWKSFQPDKTAKVYMTEEAAKKDPKAKERWMVYAINRETNEIQQAEFGITVITQLGDFQESKDYGFETLPPYDVTINRKGMTMNDTEYRVIPARTNTELTSEEMAKIMALEPLEKVVGKDAEDYLPF